MKLRRFGLVGDIHAEDKRLATALDHLAGLGLDAVLAVGDICDGQGDLERCVHLLITHQVVAVAGNHERWLLSDEMRRLDFAHFRQELSYETLSFLATLPATRTLEAVDGQLLLCHGVDGDDMQELREDDFGYALESNDALQRLLKAGAHRWMAGGHTHQRMVRRFGALTALNAGTLARDDDPGFAVVDLEARQVRFFDLDDPRRALELELRELP